MESIHLSKGSNYIETETAFDHVNKSQSLYPTMCTFVNGMGIEDGLFGHIEALSTKLQRNSYPEGRMVWPWLAQETRTDFQNKQMNNKNKQQKIQNKLIIYFLNMLEHLNKWKGQPLCLFK